MPSCPAAASRRRWPRIAVTLAALSVAVTATAADERLPPEVVASFTRRVQPLVLNRCATGACHGGPGSPAPRFERGAGAGQPDRTRTHANITAFLQAVGPDRDSRRLAALLAAGHPSAATSPSRRVTTLTAAERTTLDCWLAAVRESERPAPFIDAGVVPASAEAEDSTPERPNRFRAMLDAAANPPEFPPPAEPQGVIFKNDVPAEEE